MPSFKIVTKKYKMFKIIQKARNRNLIFEENNVKKQLILLICSGNTSEKGGKTCYILGLILVHQR